jgi:hypothetical protein
MGGIIWPRAKYIPVFLFIAVAIPCHGYQLIPDDIAFKKTSGAPATEPQVALPEQAEPEAVPAPESETDALTYDTPEADISGSSNTALNTCESQWQKNLVITAMPRLNPQTSNAGNFYAAEIEIPRLLAKELKKITGIESRLIQQVSVPTLNAGQKRQLTQQIALREETQFVLSGEILDMSMRDPNTVYNPAFMQMLRNHFTDFTMMKFADTRDRVFGLRLELRDGFTGEVLLEDNFYTQGIWKNPKPIGFNSPDLWQSQYGRRIQQLLMKAGKQLAQNIRCQPYMARIESTPGQVELLIQGGANNGLHAGDQMTLYQLVVLASPSQYETYQTRLVKRDLQLRVKEVYPSHSLALLEGDDLLNGQYLAVGAESKSF